MIRRASVLLISLIFAQFSYAQYDWVNQNTDGNVTFYDVFMLNNFEGWSVGNAGGFPYAMKTSNGVDWVANWGPTSENGGLAAAYFNSFTDGYIVADDGDIYHTNNGGTGWTLSFDELGGVYAYNITKAGSRVFVTRDDEIMYSDNGTTWFHVSVPFSGPVLGISFDPTDPSHGWICGSFGGLAYTNNAGLNWNPVSPPASYNTTDLSSIYCYGPGDFWCVGNNAALFNSTDSGTNYTEPSISTAENLLDIDFANGSHGVIAGANNTVLYTENGGALWELQPASPSSAHFNSVDTKNETTAFLAGGNGEIWKSPVGYDVCEIAYIGPDTVCAGQAFDFEIQFKNCGPSPAQDVEFLVLANSSTLFGGPVTLTTLIDTGVTTSFIAGTLTVGLGANAMTIFATEQYIQGNNSLFFDIIGVAPLPTDVTGDTFICPGDTVTMTASGGDSYNWLFTGSSDPSNPTQDFYPTQTDSYLVEITQEYCVVTDTGNVTLDPNCDIVPPIDTTGISPSESYAFTPNSDNVNDFLVLDFLDGDLANEVTIYNRWGDEVYFASAYDNAQNSWDGTFGSRRAPAGTYFFIAETSANGVVRGWVQLVR